MQRLIVTPEPVTDLRPNKAARFLARLESSGDFVVRSHQPLVDGARELLARGFDPATLLTMRHEGKTYDCFRPASKALLVRLPLSQGQDEERQQDYRCDIMLSNLPLNPRARCGTHARNICDRSKAQIEAPPCGFQPPRKKPGSDNRKSAHV